MHTTSRLFRGAVPALALCLAGSVGAAAADPQRPSGPLHSVPLSAATKAALDRVVHAKSIGTFVSRRRIPALARPLALRVEQPPAGTTLGPKPGSNAARELASVKTCEALDPSIPPAIVEIKGKVGSGGYLALSGKCFGTTGVVELAGEFPGGRLALTNQAWSPTSITAAIPSVSGVYDQTVRIRVLRGNVVSNEVAAAFVPEMEERYAPRAMIVSTHCDFDVNDCKNGSASHYSETSDFTTTASNGNPTFHSGNDQWTVQPPRGWSVSYVEGTLYAGVASIGDFDSNPGSPAVIPLQWQDNLTSFTTSFLHQLGGTGPSDKFFTAAYGLDIHVTGPKGTWR